MNIEEKLKIKDLLTNAISLLCKNCLKYKDQFCIEALIGVTLDNSDVLLVSIKEFILKDDSPCEYADQINSVVKTEPVEISNILSKNCDNDSVSEINKNISIYQSFLPNSFSQNSSLNFLDEQNNSYNHKDENSPTRCILMADQNSLQEFFHTEIKNELINPQDNISISTNESLKSAANAKHNINIKIRSFNQCSTSQNNYHKSSKTLLKKTSSTRTLKSNQSWLKRAGHGNTNNLIYDDRDSCILNKTKNNMFNTLKKSTVSKNNINNCLGSLNESPFFNDDFNKNYKLKTISSKLPNSLMKSSNLRRLRAILPKFKDNLNNNLHNNVSQSISNNLSALNNRQSDIFDNMDLEYGKNNSNYLNSGFQNTYNKSNNKNFSRVNINSNNNNVQNLNEMNKEVCDSSLVKYSKLIKNFHISPNNKAINNASSYVCPYCLIHFTAGASLKEHINGVHLNRRMFNCQTCGQTFKWRSGLSKHKRKSCRGDLSINNFN